MSVVLSSEYKTGGMIVAIDARSYLTSILEEDSMSIYSSTPFVNFFALVLLVNIDHITKGFCSHFVATDCDQVF